MVTILNRGFATLTGQGTAAESRIAPTYPARVTNLSRGLAWEGASYSFSRKFRLLNRLPHDGRIAPGSRSRLHSAIRLALANAGHVGSRLRRISTYCRYNLGNSIAPVSRNRHRPWITARDHKFITTLASLYVVLTGFYLSARMSVNW